jgi:ABC-type antimicrobial peptide transport system permease subunit
MNFFSIKIFRNQPLRLALTVGGIALCIVLMLFLWSVYSNVADGAVEYIRRNQVDLWVLQRNAWNILRGSSLLSTGHGIIISEVEGVESASPVLLLLSGIRKNGEAATVFLTGYKPEERVGGPPAIVKGRLIINDDEIVLDKAFAAKMGYAVGDRVLIYDDTLKVVGLSAGTNAFAIQYAFVSLDRAQSLIRVPSIVTCFLVRVKEGYTPSLVAERIREELPGLEVYDHATFLQNNIREMESGFLPFLFIIAVLGAVVLTVILSLLLSINILERRKDFAVLKVLGSPGWYLPKIVIKQALFMCSLGSVVALVLYFPMVMLIESVSPEVSTATSLDQIVVVVCIALLIGMLSSFISIHRLRSIYPLEVYS